MLNNSASVIHMQTVSYEKYLKDMWMAAFFFILIINETTISLPFLWVSMQLLIVVVAHYTFTRFGPSLFTAISIPTVVLLSFFLFGAPFWLYAIGVLISMCSLHYRYNVIPVEEDSDNPFALLSLAVFFLVHFICFLLGMENYKLPLYSIFVGGIIFFAGSRLFTVWRKSYKHTKVKLNQVAILYLVGLTTIFFVSFLIYFIFSPIRQLLNVILQGLFTIVMMPLTPLLIYLEEFLASLFREPTEEEPQDMEANDGRIDSLLSKNSEVSNLSISIEWILLVGLSIVVLIIVTYIIKKKIELPVEQEINNFRYGNDDLPIQEEEEINLSTIYRVEASFLRKLYLEFEKEANSLGYEREKSETVREWFKRMAWKVEGEFFSIYEEVRYGGNLVEKEKADTFVQELDKIKKLFFLKKEV